MKKERATLTKIIVIVGPTASGKSALAVRLAKEFEGEIVSADSRQVYKGLTIGTGKVTKREMAGVPHHLLDVASPKKQFTAADFVKKARVAIREIAARGHLPIVCGGTAFYIDALLGDATPAPVPPNSELRKNLEKETTDALFKKLQKLDPSRAGKIDAKNRHRLIRALEIARARNHAEQTRKNAEGDSEKRGTCPAPQYQVLKIGILMPKQELKERIKKRLAARMEKGMVAEARRLHEHGVSWKRMESLGLEYRLLARYLQEQIPKQEMLTRLETEIWRYAKRQMTWWKRDEAIHWYVSDEYNALVRKISAFLVMNYGI